MITNFIELDFPMVTSRKCMAIKRHKNLLTKIHVEGNQTVHLLILRAFTHFLLNKNVICFFLLFFHLQRNSDFRCFVFVHVVAKPNIIAANVYCL